MGVDLSVLDFLCKFKGEVKGKTLQLGRQGLHIASDGTDGHRAIADQIIHRYDPAATFNDISDDSGYTDTLFRYLGSSSVMSMDASPYEGAEIIHNLNDPVPKDLHLQFDTIFDGGTIEHVFNVPTAFDNVKAMLKVGGLFLSVNAANNQIGHGFYQFSPELMWRIFSQEAGFSVKLMQIAVLGNPPEPIDVPDPSVLGRRMEIGSTSGATYILVAARKVNSIVSNVQPNQSDYTAIWTRA